jgi:myo-inositol-1(or 4)-monophosphatase
MSPEPLPDALLGDLERLALRVASEAGLLIADRSAAAVSATKSSATDVVTEMDRRSQELLAGLLHQARPQDGFYGEEDGDRAANSEITWVVDPIDGTVNYVYDIPAFSVSVAAVQGDPRVPGAWRPIAGAIVNPISGERFWARAGGGAWRQRGRHTAARIRVSDQGDLALALVGTGFAYDAPTRSEQAQVLLEVLPRVRDIRRFGSAALDLCHVADGTLDAFYERNLNPWDLAAGWLLVTEAGGRVSNLRGEDPDRGVTIACGAAFSELAQVLKTAMGEPVGS